MQKQLLTLTLNELMDQQIQQLNQLHQHLLASRLVQAKVFTLPAPEYGEHQKPDAPIEVGRLTDAEAFTRALASWRHMFAGPGENTRLAYRLPGAVQVSPAEPDRVLQLVREINECRKAFKAAMMDADFKSANERFEFLHAPGMFPMLITLHMFRAIPLAPPESRSVSFCWANKPVMQRLTKEAVMENLEASCQTPPKHIVDPAAWQAQLEQEMVSLTTLPAGTQLQIRRPAPVQPQAWVYYGPPRTRRMFVAATPLLVVGESPIKIGDLKDYDPTTNSSPPTSPRLTDSEPLIPRLWLYRVKEK